MFHCVLRKVETDPGDRAIESWRKGQASFFGVGAGTCVLFSLVAFCLGCATTPRGASSENAAVEALPKVVISAQRYRKAYLIFPEDQIDVIVLKHPEVTRSCLVRPDGYITLPILDDVKAAGITPEELDEELTKAFSGRLEAPEVSVILTSFRPPTVYVLGEVRQPRAVPFREVSTAIQAISLAGGFTNRSNKGEVVLIRLRDDGYLEAIPLTAETKGRGRAYLSLSNVSLQPDDLLFVPRSIMGEVTVFLTDSLNPILNSVNSLLSTYTNFRLNQFLTEIN